MSIKTTIKSVAFAAVAALSIWAPKASARVFDITSVGVNSWNHLNVNGRDEVATAILLTATGLPKPLAVFCVDLAHNISVQGYNPPLQYQTGYVTTDSSGSESGTGNPLSLAQSQQIWTLQKLGSSIANSAHPDSDKLTAIAGSIWAVEYGYSASQVTGTAAQNALIAHDLAFAQAHPSAGYAPGLYAVGGGSQGFGFSQGFAGGVPEPATWTMMILGVGGIGAVLRTQRRNRTAATPALAAV